VGDAVDSYNLMRAYFAAGGVRVLGAVFNKLPADGYYSLESVRPVVGEWFRRFGGGGRAYGFLPVIPALEGARDDGERMEEALKQVGEFTEVFRKNVDVAGLLEDVGRYYAEAGGEAAGGGQAASQPLPPPPPPPPPPPLPPQAGQAKKRSRAEIEADEAGRGAAGG
jgi:hypothetical protein